MPHVHKQEQGWQSCLVLHCLQQPCHTFAKKGHFIKIVELIFYFDFFVNISENFSSVSENYQRQSICVILSFEFGCFELPSPLGSKCHSECFWQLKRCFPLKSQSTSKGRFLFSPSKPKLVQDCDYSGLGPYF